MNGTDNFRMPALNQEELKIFIQNRNTWLAKSNPVLQTDQVGSDRAISSLIEFVTKRSPKQIFWCASPWQLLVMPMLLDALLTCYDRTELRSYLESHLRYELDSQFFSGWRKVWKSVHGYLDSLLRSGEIEYFNKSEPLGRDVTSLFKENYKGVESRWTAELNNYASKALIQQLQAELPDPFRSLDAYNTWMKDELRHNISANISCEVWGQWEFRVRRETESYLMRKHHPAVVAASAPFLAGQQLIDARSPQTVTTTRAASKYGWMATELDQAVGRTFWTLPSTLPLTLHSFAHSFWKDIPWSLHLNDELELWLTVLKNVNCFSVFENACFVSANPTSVKQDKSACYPTISFDDGFCVKGPRKIASASTVRSPKSSEPITARKNNVQSKPESQEGFFSKPKNEPQSKSATSTINMAMDDLPLPQQILDWLNQFVVGQSEAKKILSVAVYNHYKRLKVYDSKAKDVQIGKSNVLLVGPTGSGKTMLVQTLAKFLKVPFACADAAGMTQAGYVGEDAENVIASLYQAAHSDLKKTERGIVYIDEIDKIRKSNSNWRDVAGEGVQQGLLKLLEGKKVKVPLSKDKSILIDTTNILFICGGAFVDLDQIIQARAGGRFSVGFGSPVSKVEKDQQLNNLLKQVCPEDLVQFGMIPEFIGRLPVVAVLEELTTETLVKILLEPKNSIVKQYQELIAMEGVQLELKEDAALAIADLAVKQKTGVRGLRSVMERIMLDIMFDLPSHRDTDKISITKEMVVKFSQPVS